MGLEFLPFIQAPCVGEAFMVKMYQVRMDDQINELAMQSFLNHEKILATGIAFLLFLVSPLGICAQPEGGISVNPDWGIAGEYGSWTVTYQVGAEGLAEGSAVRVQLPDAWHADDRNSAYPLQATRPTADHYISARTSRPDVKLRTTVESESDELLVKSQREGLTGRSERYVFVVRVEVMSGDLQPGDSLFVVYGDPSEGSRGMKTGVVATPPLPVHLAVDSKGDGSFNLHPDTPEMRIRAGSPFQLLVYGPSTLVLDRPEELNLAVVDKYNNPVPDVMTEARFEVIQGTVDIPEETEIHLEEGWATVPFTPSQTGIVRIEADTHEGLLETTVNPMKVYAEEPEQKIYWGDLHSHSHYSWDGVGYYPFQYARHVTNLDFYALTDHSIPASDGHTHGLGESVWDEYTHLAEERHAPGQFVTLHAYEASFGAPWGHHNVFFRGEPGPLLVSDNYESSESVGVSLPEMWELLAEGEALTIPHHTGKMPEPIQWEPQDSTFRRNFEIYSAHGLSEAYNPDHPLAFEQSIFTSPSTSREGPQYAHDAWAHGLKLSTISSSDDHRAQPGQQHYGLAAVKSSKLTRPAIFDALYARHTYGTTGARILLDFSINGASMGERVTVNSWPLLQLEAHGTDVIEWIEILRYSDAQGGFEVIYQIEPDSKDVTWSNMDRTFRDDSIYYVRLKQKGEIRGLAAMAWSSPIWVEQSSGE